MIEVQGLSDRFDNLTKRLDVLDLAVDDLVETTDDDAETIMNLSKEVDALIECKNNSKMIWLSQLIIDLIIVIHIITHTIGGN